MNSEFVLDLSEQILCGQIRRVILAKGEVFSKNDEKLKAEKN